MAIPVDAPPGEAQVDFGYLGTLYDPGAGRERKAWVFVLVMACSRQMVTRVVFDQTSPRPPARPTHAPRRSPAAASSWR